MRQITAYESNDGTFHHTELAARIHDFWRPQRDDPDQGILFKPDNETLAASFSAAEPQQEAK